MTTTDSELMTVTNAAAVIGITRAMVHRLIQSRDLPAQRVGPKAVLVRRIDAERVKAKRYSTR